MTTMIERAKGDAMNDLTDFDLMVLRAADGQDVPGLSWGAGMSDSVEFLSGLKLLTRGPEYQITDAGVALLKNRGMGK